VIGSGQDEKKLRRLADGNIQFLGWQSDEVLRDHLRRCQGLLFPGEEDFGIVPVEAQACGTPVIAFGRGGATETVIPWPQPNATGIWFEEQTVDCLATAIEQFETARDTFDAAKLRSHALEFRLERFEQEIFGFVNSVMSPTIQRQAA
jgi:glycosyltransferase involved in cell wall biosynthesis